jgi:hypothetical protein
MLPVINSVVHLGLFNLNDSIMRFDEIFRQNTEGVSDCQNLHNSLVINTFV